MTGVVPSAALSAGLTRTSLEVNACMYIERMPGMQVYLPADLDDMVKARRRNLQSASRRYTAELKAQVGLPAPRECARAVAMAQRIARRAIVRAC